MRRRNLLAGAGGLLVAGWSPAGAAALLNPCRSPRLPERLARHELIEAAWDGIDPERVWDGHAHLVGIGDGGTGLWVNPSVHNPAHPKRFVAYRFFRNAACVSRPPDSDRSYLRRLMDCQDGLRHGQKVMLLAFDHTYGPDGRRRLQRSAFHTPDCAVAEVAARYPDRFEWIASIHPYREDCVEALDAAVAAGARAVKWLPPAMGIDPGSPRCDRFYAALARTGRPLLTHAGDEHAVDGMGVQRFGNPLRLRRPLEHGVRVVVAHCASLGSGLDVRPGRGTRRVANFDLFGRLMCDPRYEGRLFGDVSAVTQRNRPSGVLTALLERRDWHHRLLNGSDYPLPGLIPAISLPRLVERGFLSRAEADVLDRIRPHNPLLFDFVLKRTVRAGGRGFETAVFHTRSRYDFLLGSPEQAGRRGRTWH